MSQRLTSSRSPRSVLYQFIMNQPAFGASVPEAVRRSVFPSRPGLV
ncbi:hypothetical protein ACFQZ4_12520 [Catellatospora coxensis]